MGVPLAGDFDSLVPKPIDSRMFWTGDFLYLNDITNRYPGLITFVSGEKNLYLQTNRGTLGITPWERITTTVVQSPPLITGNSLQLAPLNNGQVLYIGGDTNTTCFLPGTLGLPSGFNVSIVQMTDNTITFTGLNLRSRDNLNKTAGKYAVASILRIGSSNEFLLYGDLIN